MKLHSNSLLFSLVILIVTQACNQNNKMIDNEFETRYWGGWVLMQENLIPPSAANNGGDIYLERNYKGWMVSGNLQTTEIDSVVLYQNKKVIFADRVAEKVSKDPKSLKIIYRLSNNKFYWVQIIPVDGPEDGTGNDQLLVSDFVDNINDLEKSAVYKYVRTNSGNRPW